MFPSYPIMIRTEILSVDLIPLPLNDFHVILDMDWLAKNYATVDCHERQLLLKFLTERSLVSLVINLFI